MQLIVTILSPSSPPRTIGDLTLEPGAPITIGGLETDTVWLGDGIDATHRLTMNLLPARSPENASATAECVELKIEVFSAGVGPVVFHRGDRDRPMLAAGHEDRLPPTLRYLDIDPLAEITVFRLTLCGVAIRLAFIAGGGAEAYQWLSGVETATGLHFAATVMYERLGEIGFEIKGLVEAAAEHGRVLNDVADSMERLMEEGELDERESLYLSSGPHDDDDDEPSVASVEEIKRPAGCDCQWEEGDSPCQVHGNIDPVETSVSPRGTKAPPTHGSEAERRAAIEEAHYASVRRSREAAAAKEVDEIRSRIDAAGAAGGVQWIRVEVYRSNLHISGASFAAPCLIRIGALKSSEIFLQDEGVARLHAAIEAATDTVRLIDFGSASGTRLAGEEIDKNAELKDGDEIEIRGYRIVVHFDRAEVGDRDDKDKAAPSEESSACSDDHCFDDTTCAMGWADKADCDRMPSAAESRRVEWGAWLGDDASEDRRLAEWASTTAAELSSAFAINVAPSELVEALAAAPRVRPFAPEKLRAMRREGEEMLREVQRQVDAFRRDIPASNATAPAAATSARPASYAWLSRRKAGPGVKPLVYVAGPYTADTDEQRRANIAAAQAWGAKVIDAGGIPVIPHNMSEGIADKGDAEFWYAATLELMLRCDAVLLMPGAGESIGARAEEEAAHESGMPVIDAGKLLPGVRLGDCISGIAVPTVDPHAAARRRRDRDARELKRIKDLRSQVSELRQLRHVKGGDECN